MKHTYNISGITCGNCVSKIKSEFLKIGDILQADIQQQSPQATIQMQKHIPLNQLQLALDKAGNYRISEVDTRMENNSPVLQTSWWQTYKPVLLLFFYLVIISLISAFKATGFDWMLAMRIFMAGFFLAFSFFKMLNLKGFAEAYAGYDIIAQRFFKWGYVYAVLELLLGLAFALNFFPAITSIVTVILMSIGLVGVLRSVLNKRKIQCACLRTVFNLPMSTVTVVEDSSMLLMGILMLTQLV